MISQPRPQPDSQMNTPGTRLRPPPAPARAAVMHTQIAAIARFTLLEAWRSRLPWLLGAAMVCAVAGGALAAELAITESARFRIALIAGGVRLAWVYILAVYVISSLTREINERGFESALSLEITRTTWILGKLCGFLAIAVLASGVLAAAFAALVPPGALAAWTASLLFELSMVIAASLFFTLSLASVPAAAMLTAAFYLLARAIDALVLIAGASTLIAPGHWRDMSRLAMDGVAFMLPSLARFAPSTWLVDMAPAPGLIAMQCAQCIVFTGLLTTAALVDFHRRDL